MARRGDELREHILWTAKDVFLEMGLERTSMDLVANRAKTSKRTLYAQFESKEKLFLAVIELVQGLFLTRLKHPSDYSDQPAEALTLFCGQYLQSMLYAPSVRMGRISMAESERFPEQSALYFHVLFTQVQNRLSAYLETTLHRSPEESVDAASALLGRVLFPRYSRVLFGLEPPEHTLDVEPSSGGSDGEAVQRAVSELLDRLDRS